MKIYLVWFRENYDDYDIDKLFKTEQQALNYIQTLTVKRENGRFYDDKENYYYIEEKEVE